jgi:hypothetical protein
LEEQGNHELIQELKAEGIGSEFYNSFEKNKPIDAEEFIRWQFVEGKGN